MPRVVPSNRPRMNTARTSLLSTTGINARHHWTIVRAHKAPTQLKPANVIRHVYAANDGHESPKKPNPNVVTQVFCWSLVLVQLLSCSRLLLRPPLRSSLFTGIIRYSQRIHRWNGSTGFVSLCPVRSSVPRNPLVLMRHSRSHSCCRSSSSSSPVC